MCRGNLRYGLLLIFFWVLVLQALAQKQKFHIVSWGESWKLDAKAGTGVILSEVPSEHLGTINNVNIPVYDPGLNFVFTARKAMTGHLEMGYQLSYIDVAGNVEQEMKTYRVHTQALEHNFLVLCNLKRTDYFRPLTNYFIYYKIGAISLKNDVRQRMPDGSLQEDPDMVKNKFFMNGAAVGTGLGAGVNHQLTTNLSLLGTFELNRSSDSAGDIFRIRKIFYQSPNTVNHYLSLTFGISYTFHVVEPKKNTVFYKSNSETEKRLNKARIYRHKKEWSKRSRDFWHR